MAAAAAFSGASFSALAAPCTSNALSTYLSGGANATCTVLDATISNVTFSSTSPSFSAFDLPTEPVTATNNPGLEFSVGPRTAATSTITFTIATPSSNPMTDASLAISGTSLLPLVSETLSNGGSLSASASSTSDSTTFAATTSLTVTDTITTDINSC